MGKIMPLYRGKFHAIIDKVSLPYNIAFYFVRDSRRRFDYNNASQVLLDLMQEEHVQWLPNDDTIIVTPFFIGTHVDAKNPGVYITIVPQEDWQSILNKLIQIN